MRRLALVAALFPLALAACLHSDDDRDDDRESKLEPIPNQLRQEKIAFARRPALGDDTEIYVMNPDGTGAERLTDDGPREAEDEVPAFSPDGRMIAFVSTRTRLPDVPTVDAPPAEEIYVMNADGTDQRRLTRNTNLDVPAGWLRDGRIVFLSCPPSEDEFPECSLLAIRTDGTGREELGELGFTFSVAVSPDGRRIVYSQFEGQSHFQHFDLHVANLDGSDHWQLTDDDTGDGSPAWSPDGERIAFVSNRAESAHCFSHDCAGYTTELYVMDSDGGDVTRLTETPHEEASPAWSPDGEKIVYSRILDENAMHELYVVNADGSCATKLMPEVPGAWDTQPDWYGPANLAGRRIDC